MEQKHTRNLSVAEDGVTLGVAKTETSKYRCMGIAYGWNEEPEYGADRRLINTLTPTDEARANARLWAAAPELLEALNSVLPYVNAGEALIVRAAITKATATEEVAA